MQALSADLVADITAGYAKLPPVVIWIRRDPETSAGLFASLVSDCVAARYSGRLRSCGLWWWKGLWFEPHQLRTCQESSGNSLKGTGLARGAARNRGVFSKVMTCGRRDAGPCRGAACCDLDQEGSRNIRGSLCFTLYTGEPKAGLRFLGSSGLWYFHDRIAIPSVAAVRQALIAECHDCPSAGHQGVTKTRQRVARRFWWPHMSRSVHSYVTACSSCQLNKPVNQLPAGLLQPFAVLGRKFAHITLDLITDLPPTASGSDAYCGRPFD